VVTQEVADDSTPAGVPTHRDVIQSLAAAFQSNRDPQQALAARTAAVDELVARAAAEHVAAADESRFTIAACGGYGRRELFPYSDIDLLILVPHESDIGALKTVFSDLPQALWDAGLRVGHSVRTVADCVQLNEQNVELHISLLDLRYLAGDRSLLDELTTKLHDFYHRHAHLLMQRLAELSRARHAKYNDTVFHLEPNIKETPGGLRDWHLLHWLGLLMPQNEAIRESASALRSPVEFLSRLRCFLHFQTNRDSNLLTFDLQDSAAQELADGPLLPGEWMRLYFKGARQISQSALRALEYAETQDTSLVQQFRDWRARLSTTEFTVSREQIFLRKPTETTASGEGVLGLFAFVSRHGIRLSWDAQRRLRADAPLIEQRVATRAPKWPLWKELFEQPHVALALREMEETRALNALIPEWNAIDSLVVRDFYHRYTVDEHTFVAIEAIDDLARTKPSSPHRFRELFEEANEHALLRFALLLHDIGKGTDPGEHVRGSVNTARTIMARIDVPVEDQENILFLIEHHLDLSLVMNSRDLDDPSAARQLAMQVGTLERLRLLALLTYADISAVNPTAMTPWRLEQLWRVYVLGAEQLKRELDTDRIHSQEAGYAVLDGDLTPEAQAFLEGLPTRYLRTHGRDEILRQVGLAGQLGRHGVVVEIKRQSDAWQAIVMAADKPGLFAMVCGALASYGLNILKAEAAANHAGLVVDQFRFADPLRQLELNPTEVDQLRHTIEGVLRGKLKVEDLLKRRRPPPRPSRGASIHPMVRFNREASDTCTLIDFVGEDRPGLLYDLASALSEAGCNIELVMIDTEAHKAIDVFYVTRNGVKLSEADEAHLKVALTRAAGGG
jgi:[protein-PII] uridylyltransferase